MGSAQASRSDVFDTVDTERVELAEPECSAPADPTPLVHRSTMALGRELGSRVLTRLFRKGDGKGDGFAGRRPVLAAVLTATLAGGSGVGGSWLLGPGGLADDQATSDAIEANAAANAANALAIAANAEAIREHGRQLAALTKAIEASDAEVDALAAEDRELEAMIADGLVTQASVLVKLAAKHDIDVDLRLPPLGRRRR